ELTRAEVLALDEAEGVYDDPAWLEERDAGEVPPEDADEAGERGAAGGAEILDAGFTHGVPGASGRGFEGGGELDRMLPGRELAALTGMARMVGLGRLNDDELIGFLGAARRGVSWQQALELAAGGGLDRRRAGAGGGPGGAAGGEGAAGRWRAG